jgi:hypothetical protein
MYGERGKPNEGCRYHTQRAVAPQVLAIIEAISMSDSPLNTKSGSEAFS